MPTATLVTSLFLPRYRLDWDENEASWWTGPQFFKEEEATVTPYQLSPSEVFEFPIIAPARRLRTLSVQIGTYVARKHASLIVKMRSQTGETLTSTDIDLSQVSDNSFHPVLDLRDLSFEPGAKYTVQMTWSGKPGTEVAVYAAAMPVGSGRYQLPRHLSGLCSARTFALRPVDHQASARAGSHMLILPEFDPDRSVISFEKIQAMFPGVAFAVVTFDECIRRLTALRATDVVVFADMFHLRSHDGLLYDELCFDLHRHGVCTLFLYSRRRTFQLLRTALRNDPARREIGWRDDHARRCHFILSDNGVSSLVSSIALAPPAGLATSAKDFVGSDILTTLAASIGTRARPRVAIAAVIGRHGEYVDQFLDRVAAQSYPGNIEVVLIDDAVCEDRDGRAPSYARRLAETSNDNRSVRVFHERSNGRPQPALLRRLGALDADIYVFMDSGCLIGHDFISAHVFEHWWQDVDLVVSPYQIDGGVGDAHALIKELDADPERAKRESVPEDRILASSFVNCFRGGFSLKRRGVLDTSLFSEDGNPANGIFNVGWTYLEIGYRLYAKGAIIRAAKSAVAVRLSNASLSADAAELTKAQIDFARLLERYPELALVASRWAIDTYDRIVPLATTPATLDSTRERLDILFSARRQRLADWLPNYRGRQKRLRIITYRWHVAHQYELYKLPHDFTLVTGTGSGMTDQWSYDQRPLRANARLITALQVDPRDYDLAILHFDENVFAPHLANDMGSADWGETLRWALDRLAGLPKIAICHGTVPFVGQYRSDPEPKRSFTIHDDERRFLVGTLANAKIRVVCNSRQAALEWGFADCRVIWHGFDPQEFPPGTLSRDVLTLDLNWSRPHYRGRWEQQEVISRLRPGTGVETATHPSAVIENRSQNAFATRQFRSYVDRIRDFKVYLNTTLRSPMPRSRGEAMMTGVIPVSLANHDVYEFIENGVDGFYAHSPGDLADFINDLLNDRARVREMSRAARLKALDVFNHDRYLADWSALIRETCG